MIRARPLHRLLALGAIAALPACSGTTGSQPIAPAAAAQPMATAVVKQVQDRLQHDGYYRQGATDGDWGASTVTAVLAFQRDHSLDPSGQLDVPTLQALNVTDTDAPAGGAAARH